MADAGRRYTLEFERTATIVAKNDDEAASIAQAIDRRVDEALADGVVVEEVAGATMAQRGRRGGQVFARFLEVAE